MIKVAKITLYGVIFVLRCITSVFCISKLYNKYKSKLKVLILIIMDLTILLLKMFGFYMFVVGLSMLTNKADWKAFIGEFDKNKHFSFLAGIFTLTMGMLVVNAHNIWSGGFDVIIVTIFGWIMFLKGIMYLLFPTKYMASMAKKFMGSGYTLWASVTLLIGLYLLLSGFAVI